MFDFALFLWELLLSILSAATNNPWYDIIGRILVYLIRRLFDDNNSED